MTKKILTALAILSIAVGSAQATTLTINDIHDVANEHDFFKFSNLSAGNVDIYMDTISDGFDADVSIWTKVNTTVNGQFENSDWALVHWSPAADRPAVQDGTNVFGIALKNGYVPNDPVAIGTSDPGASLNLVAGDYLVTVGGSSGSWVTGGIVGTLMSDAFLQTFEHLATNNTFPHDYDLFIVGDVANVSNVPVPAAVWLFGTAVLGLGATRRSKAAA